MKEVDARGLSCPQPVILTKKALDGIATGTITVLLDSEVSRENVTRMARRAGCAVEVQEVEEEFHLTITKSNR